MKTKKWLWHYVRWKLLLKNSRRTLFWGVILSLLAISGTQSHFSSCVLPQWRTEKQHLCCLSENYTVKRNKQILYSIFVAVVLRKFLKSRFSIEEKNLFNSVAIVSSLCGITCPAQVTCFKYPFSPAFSKCIIHVCRQSRVMPCTFCFLDSNHST